MSNTIENRIESVIENVVVNNTASSAIAETAFTKGSVSIAEPPLAFVYQFMVFPQHQAEIKSLINDRIAINLPDFAQITNEIDDENGYKCFSTQPNKWLILSEQPLNALADIADNRKAAYLDLSSSYVAISVTGKHATDFLQQLCFIDLNQDFSVITTQMASDYTVTIEKQQNGYMLYLTRSLAKSFWDYLKVM